MIVSLFSVFDKKAEAFMSPFTFAATGQAVRAFSDTVNDGKSGFYRHPEDYDLYALGTFDECSGEFVCKKEFLLGALSVAEPRVDEQQLSLIPEGDGNGES